MSRIVRTAALAIAALLAFTLGPVGAAHAAGPGSATLTFTSQGAPYANQFVSVTAPENPFSGGFTDSAGVLTLTDLALGDYTGSTQQYPSPPASFAFTLTEAAPHYDGTIDVPGPPTGPGSFSISITSDVPLDFFTSVQVEGPGGTRFADFDGSTASLSNQPLGDYTATVPASTSGPTTSISFTLTETDPAFVGALHIPGWPTGTGSISGVVVDDDGVPIVGTSVGISSGERPFPGVTTGADGSYSYSDLPAGEYSVTAFAPGHFFRLVAVTLGDGDAAVRDITLPRADSTVSGRLVDGDGNPLALIVSATRTADGSDGSGVQAGSDGTFTVPNLGAGDWTIKAGGVGTPYQLASATVTLVSGEAATVSDLVLVPRTTASVFASVVDQTTTPFPTSVAGICGRLLLADGTVVATSEVSGVDGSVAFYDIQPGTYTVKVFDCDPSRSPRYVKQFYGGGTKLATATTFSLVAGVDAQLGDFSLVRSIKPPKPGHHAHLVPTAQLKQANKGDISAPGKVDRGTRVTIQVGTAHAGEWVSVWLHDPDAQLGKWRLVAADGTVNVKIPSSYDLGEHKLAVQDADDHVIGWTKIKIKI